MGFVNQSVSVSHIIQGYLVAREGCTVRIRIRDDEAFITVKGKSSENGLSRDEWEYPVPLSDARDMISLCNGHVVSKKRYLVPYREKVWEVDVFEGRHAGLILAELEVETESETFDLPPWIGAEVTGQKQYYNARMAMDK